MTEKKIERELKGVEREVKRLEFSLKALVTLVLILAAIGGAIGAYIIVSDRSVYIEKSTIEAPEIDLAPVAGGVLENMYVKAGDTVTSDEVVARVGDELVKTKVAGIVTKADATVGQLYNPGQTVVAMIDPSALRVVGQIDENKGLDRIHVGEYATFTVDAFGSRTYTGVVDEVSPEAASGDVVFQISDKRQEQTFDVKVRFDENAYPELKNGMSARLWVSAN
ncbi:MAG: HlyD family efflux transporter periplasmic adaptor subunit [Patescibacteria group bacterium]|nr:HlyD family efflux transporter periplasmic adaptor subunit [Patescibacteria group bacterium]MDE2172737.1 HlyD family efflux transporter periplasmic adaptor subunit [Patescibacteria group bacterium]